MGSGKPSLALKLLLKLTLIVSLLAQALLPAGLFAAPLPATQQLATAPEMQAMQIQSGKAQIHAGTAELRDSSADMHPMTDTNACAAHCNKMGEDTDDGSCVKHCASASSLPTAAPLLQAQNLSDNAIATAPWSVRSFTPQLQSPPPDFS
ncbi:hypothetical protein KJI95_11850 [Shewanella sp. JM162201]|uniref:Uncharacterized protein n=1 Tax=Shewanella jiangmenensis TaxID=2837387 RepID=A0ABS5V434_9GAMM|nr:hypothetical protein [Shewanella jiangmenensis]MBT1445214.1 hypothetical protein [Shewanella jiangmenensis]